MIIIDGNNQLNRVLKVPEYFLLQFAGKPTGGVYGFLKTLNTAMAGTPKNDKVIVVWDSKHSARRKILYPEYKANRIPKNDQEKQIKEDYFKSFNPQKKALIEDFLPCLGICNVTIQDFEADDVIFKIIEQFKDENILLISEDRDMLQMITHFPKMRVYRPIAQMLVTIDNFKQVTGVHPSLYLLFKALCGDDSDNIKAIAGVGEGTITKLINNLKATTQEDAVKELLDYTKAKFIECKPEKLSREAKVYQGWGVISRNLELCDLSREVFSNSDVESLKSLILNFKPKLYRAHFTNLCAEYGFNSILNNMNFWLKPFEI